MKTNNTSPLLQAIENTWRSIQKQHPQTKPALFTIYRQKSTRGYFHANQWETRSKEKYDEVSLSTTILNEGATSVLRTLLHEAAHSINNNNKIKDTSRKGKYHNHNFKNTAENMGLICEKNDQIGIVTIGLTKPTIQHYKEEIKHLNETITAWQNTESKTTSKEKSRMIKATCECGFIIYASQKTYSNTTIICEECKTPFEI